MASAFETMAVSMWDMLCSVLVAEQASFDTHAEIRDGYANEVGVYRSPECNPPDVDRDPDLILKVDAVELGCRLAGPARVGRVVKYAEPAFHRVLADFLGQIGIQVAAARLEALLVAPPDPPLVSQRARCFLDCVLERYPQWRCSYGESFRRGHDQYADATLARNPESHYSISFGPGEITGHLQPDAFFLPLSDIRIDSTDPDFRKRLAAVLAENLVELDLSGLP